MLRDASNAIAECTRGDISAFSGTPMKKETTHSEQSMFFLTHVSQSMIMSLTIEIGTDISAGTKEYRFI